MTALLQPGIEGQASVVVTPDNTAIKAGSGSVPVFATPMLVALMENAAMQALNGKLAEGQSSVGTKVEINHTAPTPLGMTVTANAKLQNIDGKKILFEVTAVDDKGQIAYGKHERVIIDVASFMAKAEKKQKREH